MVEDHRGVQRDGQRGPDHLDRPRAGETLFKGDEIELVVSKGPPLVEVPNVVGQGVDAATATLRAAGFEVDVEKSDTYIGLGYVLEPGP